MFSALLGRYRELLAEVDTWYAHCCSLVAGDQIACQRGCSGCCRGLFDITLLDACLLQNGFMQLPLQMQHQIAVKAKPRIMAVRTLWPDFEAPFLLNGYPEEQWDLVMPDDDETPCPLLDEQGHCLIYDSRPMTCRLHGIPLVDTSGELLFEEWCSLNFTTSNPLEMEVLRAPFNDIFKHEQLLFREFTTMLLGCPFNELDTMVPAAILIDFEHFTLPESLWSTSSS